MAEQNAWEDFIADSLETMFTQGDPAKAIADLKSENRGLFDEIKKFVDKWVSKLKAYYKGKTISEEGAMVAQLENFEKIQNLFMEAMEDAGKNFAAAEVTDEKSTTPEGDVKLSGRNYDDFDKPITEDDVTILRSIGWKSINDFTSEDIEKSQKWAYKFIGEYGIKSPFLRAWFGEWRQNSTERIFPVKQVKGALLKNGRAKNRDTEMEMSWNAHDIIGETKKHAVKDRISVDAIQQLDENVENAIFLDTVISMPTSKSKMKNTAFMHSFYSIFDTGTEIHLIKLYAEMALNNKGDAVFTRAYQLKDIKKVATLAIGVSGAGAPLSYANAATINTVADLVEAVKKYDKDYSPSTQSKIVNPDGAPKVMYHGTNYDFTVFDKRKAKAGAFGKGFYFSPSRSVAEMYGSKNNLGVYLNIKNPYVVTDSIGFTAEEYRKIQQELNIKERITDANVHKILAQNGYDGIMVYAQNGQLREAVVFDSNQIKSATDNIGTFDPQNKDINFSLRNEEVDNSPRGILMRMDVKSWKLDAEKYHLGRYQERVTLLGESEARLAEVKAEIERLSTDKKGNRKELSQLRNEQRNLNTTINGLKRDIKFTEQTDMFRKMVSDGRLQEYRAEQREAEKARILEYRAEQREAEKARILEYRAEQREAEKARILEYRAMRNEITGMNDVMTVMEDEFVRLAKDLEDKKIDLKTMEVEFLRLAKEYDKQGSLVFC